MIDSIAELVEKDDERIISTLQDFFGFNKTHELSWSRNAAAAQNWGWHLIPRSNSTKCNFHCYEQKITSLKF